MKSYIKDIMKAKGVKQKQLADALGVSLSTIKTTLYNDNMNTTTLERIATALDVEPWTLLVDPARVPYIYKAMETDVEALAKENVQLKERLAQMETKLKELFRDL